MVLSWVLTLLLIAKQAQSSLNIIPAGVYDRLKEQKKQLTMASRDLHSTRDGQ